MRMFFKVLMIYFITCSFNYLYAQHIIPSSTFSGVNRLNYQNFEKYREVSIGAHISGKGIITKIFSNNNHDILIVREEFSDDYIYYILLTDLGTSEKILNTFVKFNGIITDLERDDGIQIELNHVVFE